MKSSPDGTVARSLAALLVGGVVIGLSPIFVRLSEVGPVSTAVWRVILALLPLLAWEAARKNTAKADDRPRSLRDAGWLAFPGVMLAGDLIAWHISIQLTSVANASLLANLAPIFVTLASWLLFGSLVSRKFLAGLALAVGGVFILNSGAGSGPGAPSGGDALAILASVFYAGYVLSLSRLRGRYSTLTTMLWSSAAAALCMLPVALVWEPNFWPATASAWVVVLALGWICHAGGQGLIIYALALLPASFSSLTLLIQPVVAACAAWLLLNEPLGPAQIVGGAVVLMGILAARRG
jgi:drug/metabolite transporter (DMT)-like permease